MSDKKRVLLLGATGMLGSEIYDTLRDKYRFVVTARNYDRAKLLKGSPEDELVEFDTQTLMHDVTEKKNSYLKEVLDDIGEVDYVINAIGVTIPFALENPGLTFFTNSALPHILARHYGKKFIHITTDCVYSGKGGAPYDELAPASPTDLYGLSKSLGEPSSHSLTIRTSIIGRELGSHNSLVDWFLHAAQSGTVNGYTNHLWNGITTHQFALICDKIMERNWRPVGLYHVFSNAVTKYEMLLALREHFNVDCEIVRSRAPIPIDRRLSTIRHFNELFKIPPFTKMITEL